MRYLTAQKVFGVIFLVITLGFGAFNIYTQGPAILANLQLLEQPSSPEEIKPAIAAVESAVNTNIAWKTKFVDSYAYLQLLMGKDEVANFDVIRAKDGSMYYAHFYPESTDQLQEYAKRIRRMQDYVGEDCPVLFLSPPAMYTRGSAEFATGIPYYDQNPQQDALLYYLQSYDVDYIDSRTTFAKKDLPPEKYIFRTDHHWTIEACFESMTDVVDAFRNLYNVDLDPSDFYTNTDNYYMQTYLQVFLGSLGQRSGVAYSGLDDFTVIWPQFDSQYKYEYIDSTGQKGTLEGTFEEALLYTEALRTADPYNTSMYSVYLGGVKAWSRITNRNNREAPKLLIIHDSYSVPLATFLAPMFSEIHMIWPLAEGYDTDIEEYIEDHDFDYIIIELFPGNFEDEALDFFKEPLEVDDVG